MKAEYQLYYNITPVVVSSSTDATPIVVTTSSAHGYSNNDLVLIYGHTTNIAANGIYKIANKASSTFELTDRYTGADIAGTGGGAGSSGVVIPSPKIMLVEDFRNVVLSVITAGTATLTLKIAGSLGKPVSAESGGHGDTPNFGILSGKDDPWQFLQAIDLDTGVAINGATGIVVAGTDINKSYEVNINLFKYLIIFPVTFTQGSINVNAQLRDNG